jgi:hypothetical protein
MPNTFKPIDFIACIAIVGAFYLIFRGLDGVVGTILTTIVAFYFTKKEIDEKKKDKIMPEAKKETVEQIIRRIAKKEGIDVDLAVRIAKCESGLDPGAKHVNGPNSIDRGLFQWNNYYHPEITDSCAYDVECSTHAFCKAYKEGHIDWWNASKKCWDI